MTRTSKGSPPKGAPTGSPRPAHTRASRNKVDRLLERGWRAYENDQLPRAAEVALEIIALAPNVGAVEGHVLLGAARAAQGESQEALTAFRRALELGDESSDAESQVDAFLRLAELLADPDGEFCEFEEAAELCERAADLADDARDQADAFLLQAEALIRLDELEEARASLQRIDQVPAETDFLVRLGGAWLDADRPVVAKKILAGALAIDGDDADALHTLGLVHERLEETAEMVQCFLRVREIDLADEPPAWGMPTEKFQEVAERAFRELPPRIQEKLGNVPILASDYPAAEVVAEGFDPRMLGFFSGVPYPEKRSIGGVPHIDCIFLYQRNIERFSQSLEETVDEIRTTLLHETGHFFALEDEDLEEIGLG